MYKAKFTLSDDTEEYEGYTDGTEWNGWAAPFFTRDQLTAAMFPLDVRLLEPGQLNNRREYPVALIYLGNGEEDIIESSPIVVNGEILEVYTMEGYEFMEVSK